MRINIFCRLKEGQKTLKIYFIFSKLCGLLRMSELAFEIPCQKLIERFHIIVLLIFDYFINFIREGNRKPLHMIEYKEIKFYQNSNTITRSSLLLFTLETIAMSFFLCVLVLALDSKSKFVQLRMHDIGINDGINICFVLCW